MTKRKLDEFSGAVPRADGISDRATRLQQRQLEDLIEQGKRALFRSLKVARGFERQKLGRRQKAAKAENNITDNARLDAEVAALKVCCHPLHRIKVDEFIVESRSSLNCRNPPLQNDPQDQIYRICSVSTELCTQYSPEGSKAARHGECERPSAFVQVWPG